MWPHRDARRAPDFDRRHAAAISDEAIHRPFGRGREIQFAIRFAVGQRDEYLEAGVAPQLVGAGGGRSVGNTTCDISASSTKRTASLPAPPMRALAVRPRTAVLGLEG